MGTVTDGTGTGLGGGPADTGPVPDAPDNLAAAVLDGVIRVVAIRERFRMGLLATADPDAEARMGEAIELARRGLGGGDVLATLRAHARLGEFAERP